MEYFKLINTIEFDIKVVAQTKIVRVELLKSNINNNKYRAKLMEITDYNLYPSIINTGPKGEDLKQCHSADRIWRDLPVEDSDLYIGYVAESEEAALERAIKALKNEYNYT